MMTSLEKPGRILYNTGMGLNAVTERVLKLVEENTGYPVHVEPDPTLPAPTFATVVMARGSVPLHTVRYQPHAITAPDYYICYQCGFILRLYGLPADKRYDLARNERGVSEVRKLVMGRVAEGVIPATRADAITQFLYDGLLFQLRSMPIGMRIDDWILAEYPELAGLQKEAVMRQLGDNVAGLKPDIQKVMPGKSVNLNLSMNAAFAEFWARRLQQPQLTLPFKVSGHLQAGSELFRIWQSIAHNPAEDCRLVNAWAESLGVLGWYEWQPYSVKQ